MYLSYNKMHPFCVFITLFFTKNIHLLTYKLNYFANPKSKL